MTRAHAGFASVVQPEWPRPRGWHGPDGSTRSARHAARRRCRLGSACAQLGLETVRDLLEHRPRRYERAVDEIAIAQLWGDDEVAIAGEVVRTSARGGCGRRTIVTARITDGTARSARRGSTSRGSPTSSTPGTHLRLRGKLGRYGFDVKSYDVGAAPRRPTSRRSIPRARRYPRSGCATLVAAALAHVRPRSSTRCRPSCERCRCRGRRARGDPPPADAERGRDRRAGGSRSTSCSRCSSASRAARRASAVAPSLGDAGELIGRYREVLPFALTAAPGAGDRGDRPRPRADGADAAAAAGRRRLRQDGRGALRAAACGREAAARAR